MEDEIHQMMPCRVETEEETSPMRENQVSGCQSPISVAEAPRVWTPVAGPVLPMDIYRHNPDRPEDELILKDLSINSYGHKRQQEDHQGSRKMTFTFMDPPAPLRPSSIGGVDGRNLCFMYLRLFMASVLRRANARL